MDANSQKSLDGVLAQGKFNAARSLTGKLGKQVNEMAKVLTFQMNADEAKQLDQEARECLAELDRVGERMERRQGHIESLRTETRAMLNQLLEQMKVA